VIRQEAKPLMGNPWLVIDVDPIDQDAAPVRRVERRQTTRQRGLTRTVRADQSRDAARR